MYHFDLKMLVNPNLNYCLKHWLTLAHCEHVTQHSCRIHSRHWLQTTLGHLPLKSAVVSEEDILHFFNVKICSVLEYSSPVFTSMLTQENISDIERVPKIALKVILNDRYENYDQACILLNTQSLELRRKSLALTFALKCLKSKQHKHLFKPRISTYYKLRNLKSFEEPFCRTQRYRNSPLPYLTRLLNEHFAKL